MPETASMPDKAKSYNAYEQHYSCENCSARCCRFPWGITVTKEEHQRYQATPWIAEKLKQEKTDFKPKDHRYMMPFTTKQDGKQGCVFLDDDNLCSIQKKEGHAAIPKTCQFYPFSVTADTEKNLYTNTSFFCKSIYNNYGQPLKEIVTEKHEIHGKAGNIALLPPRLALADITLNQPEYMLLAEKLQSLFGHQAFQSVSTALYQGKQLLNEIVQNTPINEPVTPECIENAYKTALTHTLDTLEIQRGNMVGKALTSIFLSTLVAKKNNPHQNMLQSTQEKWDALHIILNLMGEKNTLIFWDFPAAVQLQEAANITFDEQDSELQQQFKRYYFGLFYNKHFFTIQHNLWNTYFLLAAHYAASIRMAKYLTLSKGLPVTGATELQEAIGLNDVKVSHAKVLENSVLSVIESKVMKLLALQPQSFEKILLSESQ